MEVIIVPNANQMADLAAGMVAHMLAHKTDAVLGLPTGSTPVGLYQRLIARHRAGQLSFRQATTFNLDEYLGLEEDSEHSYRHTMQRQLFDHIDIPRRQTHFPCCRHGEDPRAVGVGYEASIARSGGIDLQILGIGGNGHIGFNEPTSSLASRTRVKTLSKHTLAANRRLFNDDEFQPQLAITMGIATIMDARRILLMASGERKAAAIRAAIEGPVSALHPASMLQQHPHVRVLIDEAAASELDLIDYYRWVDAQAGSIAAQFDGGPIADPWFAVDV